MNRHRLIGIVLLFYLPLVVVAQDGLAETCFQGLIDGVCEVRLFVSGQKYGEIRGSLEYMDSGLASTVQGKIDGDRIRLQEINSGGLFCGSIEATILNDGIIGYWYNLERTIRLPVNLKARYGQGPNVGRCEEVHSLQVYNGVLRGGKTRLMIINAPGSPLRGALFYGGMRQRWTLEEKGGREDTLVLSITNEAGQSGGHLELITGDSSNTLFVRIKGLIDGRLEGFLHRELDWSGKCPGYSGYSVQYHSLYYHPDSPEIAAFLEKQATLWLNQSKEAATGLEEQYTDPEDRARFRFDAWFEPVYISPSMVSGYWLWSGPGKETILPVNYSVTGQEALTWENLLSPAIDSKKRIGLLVEEAVRKRPLWQDKNFVKFLKGAEFPHFIIRKSGLEVFTEFDAIYGRFSVVLPWSDLKDMLAVPFLMHGEF